jgi:hypothetical protein
MLPNASTPLSQADPILFQSTPQRDDTALFEHNLPSNFEVLMPEFQELLEKMGTMEVHDLTKLMHEFPEMESSAPLLPTGLLDTQQTVFSDLEETLNRAQVPEELKPIFKEAFSNVQYAFTKPHDEREVMLATAARAVIGSMPPSEAAPLTVLDTLLAFLNELRVTYAKTESA